MSTINIRADNDLKLKSQKVFNELGLDMTTAITIFLKAVVRSNSIPFSLEIPNKETLKAIKEVDLIAKRKKKSKKYSSVNELRKDLKV